MNNHFSISRLFISFIFFSFVFASLGIYLSAYTVDTESSSDNQDSPVIVIDAGHGGEDGGASSYGSVSEKELNLLIANNLSDMLRFCGIDIVMTRTEDILLYDKNSDYHGKKKSQDLSKRLEIANSTSNAILISIHMNAFPEEKYKGLQVYCSPHNESSLLLAEQIQNNSKTYLSPENQRRVKKADSKIYLLDRFEGTGVLVECGFLSNHKEYALLCTEKYRKRLSLVLLKSIVDYIDQGGR